MEFKEDLYESEGIVMDRVAVIILNYNTWKDTLKEIELVNSICGVSFNDVIVVDNASPNDSAKMLEKASDDKGFIFIKSLENKGYAAGNNIGMRYAYKNGYKFAWILNNDIIIEDNWIVKKFLEIFTIDASVAVINSDVYAPGGYMFNRDAKRPTFFDYTIGMNQYRRSGRQIIDRGGYAYIYRPQGCCMMVDLEKMNAIDYMDEHTFLYIEEPILAERLLKKGYFCACCLTTDIIHNHSKTVKTVFDKRKIRKIQNESFRYYLKEYRKYSDLKIRICLAFNSLKMKLLEM